MNWTLARPVRLRRRVARPLLQLNPMISESDQSRWFAEEVLPHEPALRAYLRSRFPRLSNQDDVVQEAYLRVLRAKRTGHIAYAKAFLFTTARNAALDLFRRKNAAPTEEITDLRKSHVLEERPNAAELVTHQQELDILADAIASLPERCREVITLRYAEGLSYKEIAARLGISPETVKVHMVKGIKRCAGFFQRTGLLNRHAAEKGTP
jgi:RNA polymerase sigma factor (sigma-70 family)